MKTLMRNQLERCKTLPVVTVLFFSAFYLFLWLYVGPQLYHNFEISRWSLFFETGWSFLRDYLSYPSGPSQYLSAFLTQLCYFPWLGALFITLIAWALYRLTSSLTAIKADSLWRVMCYMPALLILLICGRYENPLSMSVAVLFAALFSVLYEKFSSRAPTVQGTVRAVVFLIACSVAYYIIGSAALLFVALAALYELFHQRKPTLAVLYLLLGVALCLFLNNYIFKLETSELLLFSNPFSPIQRNLEREKWTRVFEGTLFVGIPFIVLLVDSGRWLVGIMSISQTRAQQRRDNSAVKKRIPGRLEQGRLKWVVQVVLLALIALSGVSFFHSFKLRKTLRIDYFDCRRKWLEVLAFAGTIPLDQYHSYNVHSINRALYHTGRMGDEMFTYPQAYDTKDLLFGMNDLDNEILIERIELCLELGLVNVAERMAQDFSRCTNDRPNPFVLKQFALIYIVKGKIKTARVYLRVLSRNLIYGREARDLLGRLEIDPLLENDEYIQRLRSMMMTTDSAYQLYNENDCLTGLLNSNKYNKMAFEYLMAHYLLTGQLNKFVENLPRLDDFGYDSIPRHYQEAILLYAGATQKQIYLGDRQISAETLRQYQEFRDLLDKFGDNMELLWHVSAPKFGRTYFFYNVFRLSGVSQ